MQLTACNNVQISRELNSCTSPLNRRYRAIRAKKDEDDKLDRLMDNVSQFGLQINQLKDDHAVG